MGNYPINIWDNFQPYKIRKQIATLAPPARVNVTVNLMIKISINLHYPLRSASKFY